MATYDPQARYGLQNLWIQPTEPWLWPHTLVEVGRGALSVYCAAALASLQAPGALVEEELSLRFATVGWHGLLGRGPSPCCTTVGQQGEAIEVSGS